jgi:hypothetical protein
MTTAVNPAIEMDSARDAEAITPSDAAPLSGGSAKWSSRKKKFVLATVITSSVFVLLAVTVGTIFHAGNINATVSKMHIDIPEGSDVAKLYIDADLTRPDVSFHGVVPSGVECNLVSSYMTMQMKVVETQFPEPTKASVVAEIQVSKAKKLANEKLGNGFQIKCDMDVDINLYHSGVIVPYHIPLEVSSEETLTKHSTDKCFNGWTPPPHCAAEFEFKNKTYNGCTTAGSHAPGSLKIEGWCSRDTVYAGRWAKCLPCNDGGDAEPKVWTEMNGPLGFTPPRKNEEKKIDLNTTVYANTMLHMALPAGPFAKLIAGLFKTAKVTVDASVTYKEHTSKAMLVKNEVSGPLMSVGDGHDGYVFLSLPANFSAIVDLPKFSTVVATELHGSTDHSNDNWEQDGVRTPPKEANTTDSVITFSAETPKSPIAQMLGPKHVLGWRSRNNSAAKNWFKRFQAKMLRRLTEAVQSSGYPSTVDAVTSTVSRQLAGLQEGFHMAFEEKLYIDDTTVEITAGLSSNDGTLEYQAKVEENGNSQGMMEGRLVTKNEELYWIMVIKDSSNTKIVEAEVDAKQELATMDIRVTNPDDGQRVLEVEAKYTDTAGTLDGNMEIRAWDEDASRLTTIGSLVLTGSAKNDALELDLFPKDDGGSDVLAVWVKMKNAGEDSVYTGDVVIAEGDRTTRIARLVFGKLYLKETKLGFDDLEVQDGNEQKLASVSMVVSNGDKAIDFFDMEAVMSMNAYDDGKETMEIGMTATNRNDVLTVQVEIEADGEKFVVEVELSYGDKKVGAEIKLSDGGGTLFSLVAAVTNNGAPIAIDDMDGFVNLELYDGGKVAFSVEVKALSRDEVLSLTVVPKDDSGKELLEIKFEMTWAVSKKVGISLGLVLDQKDVVAFEFAVTNGGGEIELRDMDGIVKFVLYDPEWGKSKPIASANADITSRNGKGEGTLVITDEGANNDLFKMTAELLYKDDVYTLDTHIWVDEEGNLKKQWAGTAEITNDGADILWNDWDAKAELNVADSSFVLKASGGTKDSKMDFEGEAVIDGNPEAKMTITGDMLGEKVDLIMEMLDPADPFAKVELLMTNNGDEIAFDSMDCKGKLELMKTAKMEDMPDSYTVEFDATNRHGYFTTELKGIEGTEHQWTAEAKVIDDERFLAASVALSGAQDDNRIKMGANISKGEVPSYQFDDFTEMFMGIYMDLFIDNGGILMTQDYYLAAGDPDVDAVSGAFAMMEETDINYYDGGQKKPLAYTKFAMSDLDQNYASKMVNTPAPAPTELTISTGPADEDEEARAPADEDEEAPAPAEEDEEAPAPAEEEDEEAPAPAEEEEDEAPAPAPDEEPAPAPAPAGSSAPAKASVVVVESSMGVKMDIPEGVEPEFLANSPDFKEGVKASLVSSLGVNTDEVEIVSITVVSRRLKQEGKMDRTIPTNLKDMVSPRRLAAAKFKVDYKVKTTDSEKASDVVAKLSSPEGRSAIEDTFTEEVVKEVEDKVGIQVTAKAEAETATMTVEEPDETDYEDMSKDELLAELQNMTANDAVHSSISLTVAATGATGMALLY